MEHVKDLEFNQSHKATNICSRLFYGYAIDTVRKINETGDFTDKVSIDMNPPGVTTN